MPFFASGSSVLKKTWVLIFSLLSLYSWQWLVTLYQFHLKVIENSGSFCLCRHCGLNVKYTTPTQVLEHLVLCCWYCRPCSRWSFAEENGSLRFCSPVPFCVYALILCCSCYVSNCFTSDYHAFPVMYHCILYHSESK